ncbi:MAG: 50S ribosomal protein L16 [bacterium]|nr:50S ribosomal protein L16 [bacterium]
MLQPKKQKHRKQQKGRSRKRLVETRGLTLAFGDFGLQAQSAHWINGRQIEAARKSITNFLKREGKLWIRIFPDKPVTKMPPEVTMGGGKGDVDHYVCPVKPGRIMFEVAGIDEKSAREALRLASFKLPVKTKIVIRETK